VDDGKRGGLRLFLAVEVPKRQKRSVEQAIAPLRAEIGNARWTAHQMWHVTLKFFGEVAEDRLEAVQEVISQAVIGTEVIESQLTDIGAFPNLRRARVLWVGMTDPTDALRALAGRVEAGWPDARPRALHPHITLARFNHPARVANVVDKFRPLDLDRTPFAIEKTILYRSHLGSGGPRYEALAEFSLE
jgi:2'-5' RNA ligase